jgi:hypothetical protein
MRALVIALLFIVAGVKSGIQAQNFIHPVNQVKNASKAIYLAANVNVEAKAVPLHTSINSPYEDIKPRLAPCGKRLYFSRTFHPANTNGVNDPEDIWYSDFNSDTNEWSEPIRLTGELNNFGPNYVNNVSVTGDTIILGNTYLKKGKMRSGVSYSVNVNGQWSTPKAIETTNDYNISDHANAFVSLKNGVVIRSIQRTESLGGRDLFVSFWDGKIATEPINMGSVINTEFEESSPYLAPDNKTLYFASKGHHGYGGYDIYVTRRLDNSWTNWSKPENLGPAVNGELDDEFFSVSQCGNFATFSKRMNVHNVDLYRISMEELFNVAATKPENKTKKMEAFASL